MSKSFQRIFFLFRLHKSVPFVLRFFTTKAISWKKKGFFFALIVGYVVLPFDLIHDYLPIIGIVDDVALTAILLDIMKKQAPELIDKK